MLNSSDLMGNSKGTGWWKQWQLSLQLTKAEKRTRNWEIIRVSLPRDKGIQVAATLCHCCKGTHFLHCASGRFSSPPTQKTCFSPALCSQFGQNGNLIFEAKTCNSPGAYTHTHVSWLHARVQSFLLKLSPTGMMSMVRSL